MIKQTKRIWHSFSDCMPEENRRIIVFNYYDNGRFSGSAKSNILCSGNTQDMEKLANLFDYWMYVPEFGSDWKPAEECKCDTWPVLALKDKDSVPTIMYGGNLQKMQMKYWMHIPSETLHTELSNNIGQMRDDEHADEEVQRMIRQTGNKNWHKDYHPYMFTYDEMDEDVYNPCTLIEDYCWITCDY